MKEGVASKNMKPKQPRKVAYGEGGLSYLKDRGVWRKFYYIDEQTTDGISRVKKSVTHADMTQAIRLAQKAVEGNDLFWKRLKEQREEFNNPELLTPYHPDTLAIKVPRERLERLPEVIDSYIATRYKYRKNAAVRGLKSGTLKRYRSHLSSLRSDSLGNLTSKPMRYLTLDQDILPHFVNYLKTHDPDTAKRYRGFLIGIGEFAEDANIWDRNLFKKLTAVAEDALTTEKKILTLAEVDRLFDAAQNPKFKRPKIRQSVLAALRLLRLGLRPTEVFALSLADLVDEETIKISYAQICLKPEWNTWSSGAFVWLEDPKTLGSMANVTIPTAFMEDIKKSAERSESDLVPCYDKPEGRHMRFIAPNLQGRAWLYNNARRMIQDLFEFAKVEVEVTGGGNSRFLYCFRYTYASELMALGASDVEMMALMRHKDANMSKTVYAKARESDLHIYREYREKIEDQPDYNKVIVLMDEDRRKKVKPWK